MKQFHTHMDDRLHQDLKVYCAMHGITIQVAIEQALRFLLGDLRNDKNFLAADDAAKAIEREGSPQVMPEFDEDDNGNPIVR